MKIAIIHYRLVNMGGLETRLLNYIDAFRNKGHQVTVIYAKKSNNVKLPENVNEIRIKLGITPKRFRTLLFSKKLKKVMNKNNFDFSLSLGRTGSQTAVLAPCTHLGYLKALNKTSRNIQDRIEIDLDKVAYQNSDVIFACSEMIKQELINLYKVASDKIITLYPPLNNQKYFPAKSKEEITQLKDKYGIQPQTTNFLFVSTSHKRKGLPLLLELFEQLPKDQFQLYIVGKPKVKSNLPNVNYLGYYTNLRDIYVTMDFTIHPSIYEPFGQIISESIQCNTPVIVSNNVGAKEIVNEKNGIIINSLEANDWINEIKTLSQKSFDIDKKVLIENNIYVNDHVDRIINFAN